MSFDDISVVRYARIGDPDWTTDPRTTAMAAELAAYRAAVVPRPDYDRMRGQRDSANIRADEMTREMANLRDKRANVALREAIGYIQAELREHAKEFVHPATAMRRSCMRAFVVEHGGKVGEE